MKITAKDNDMNDMQLSYKHTGFLPRTVADWTSNACQPQPKILTQKNIIFHCCLLHVIHDLLFSGESVYF